MFDVGSVARVAQDSRVNVGSLVSVAQITSLMLARERAAQHLMLAR